MSFIIQRCCVCANNVGEGKDFGSLLETLFLKTEKISKVTKKSLHFYKKYVKIPHCYSSDIPGHT